MAARLPMRISKNPCIQTIVIVKEFIPIIRSLRINQWTKNAVVLAAFFFAFWDPGQSTELVGSLLRVIPAAIIFCLVSSGIYLLNDIRDRDADRAHPLKKNRPIASGELSVPTACCVLAGLLVVGCAGAWCLAPQFLGVVAGYIALQVVYSFGLKRVALIDVMVISSGFVLRAIAGAVVLHVQISEWLLLCTFFLAIFLALCKRRHEKVLLNDLAKNHRASLESYDEKLTDLLIAIISAATIVCYSMYTLSPTTVEKFGTSKLGFTIPFVVFGVFRYLDLAYRHGKAGRPEKVLLTDIPILINLVLYGITAVVIFVLGADH